jgi:hypothetical protein
MDVCSYMHCMYIYVYCMADNSHGELIFDTFVVDLEITKLFSHEN